MLYNLFDWFLKGVKTSYNFFSFHHMFEEFVERHNLPKYRIKQFNQHFYEQAVDSFEEMSTFSKDVRNKMQEELTFFNFTEVKKIESGNSETIKVLLERKSDKQKIEAVLMQHNKVRNTVCVSCMIGCPLGCLFCATGRMGYLGTLDAQEMVDQVMYFQRLLKKKGERVGNVVFMGMGEPMLNLEEVQKALEVITDPNKIGISKRRVTISTCGLIEPLRKFIDKGFQGRLAISLHAPNQKLREGLMPIAKSNNLIDLFQVLDEYTDKTNKRITYEYILIKGVNDDIKDAYQLARLLRGKLAHVNLIPYNPIKGVGYQRSEKERIRRFNNVLYDSNIHCSIRSTMGDDVGAACGQLAVDHKK